MTCLIFSKRGISGLGSGEDYDEATELLQQARCRGFLHRIPLVHLSCRLPPAVKAMAAMAALATPKRDPGIRATPPQEAEKDGVFPWENWDMGGPVTLGSPKNGNKNINDVG